MGAEDFNQNKPEDSGFKFAEEAEMTNEAEKIAVALIPFFGHPIAEEIKNYLLDAAHRMDQALRILLSEDSIREDFTYDGQMFTHKKDLSAIKAYCGFEMLRHINSKQIEVFFKEKPVDPYPEMYVENLKDMFDYLLVAYISTVALPNRLADIGTIKPSLSYYKIEEPLGDMSMEEKEESLLRMQNITETERKKQEEERIQKLLESLAKQLKKPEE